ncbi:MAG: hypothetical protein WCL18_04410 [bacterium]
MVVIKERTSVATQESLSLSLTQSSERSWFEGVDTTGVTVVRESIPGVVLAQVGNMLKAATKPRTTVVNIFVFLIDATLISGDKE